MKYIVKEISEPMAVHKVELILCRLDKASLTKPDNRYAKLTGGQRYDMVRDMTTFADLKRLLYDEQGGICCYCGAKLEYPVNSRSRVEHVKPKNIHRFIYRKIQMQITNYIYRHFLLFSFIILLILNLE